MRVRLAKRQSRRTDRLSRLCDNCTGNGAPLERPAQDVADYYVGNYGLFALCTACAEELARG